MRSTSASAAVREALGRRIARWDPPRPWAVAYSGGRDSAVLLWALAREAGPGTLTALHVDHGWRSAAERAAEASVAEAFCRGLGVSLVSVPAPQVPADREASARRHRYWAFEAWLEGSGGGTVWLAHHQDDQAETILMRLLQGRSWQGLAGIPARRGPYCRPFLGLSGALLTAAAAEERLPYHEDSTNRSEEPLRNYLRQRVFPLLNDRFAAAPRALASFGRRWSALAPASVRDPAWARVTGGWEVAAMVWDAWPPIVREAQLLACRDPGPPDRLSRRFLEALVRPGRTKAAQGQGLRWSRRSETVRWERVVQAPLKEYFIQVGGPGTTDLESCRLSWNTGGSGWPVPGIDPGRPWSVRSWDGPGGDRHRRRRLLGSLPPDRAVLIGQDGVVRAVADTAGLVLHWTDSSPGKLINPGIFVSLERRSEYE